MNLSNFKYILASLAIFASSQHEANAEDCDAYVFAYFEGTGPRALQEQLINEHIIHIYIAKDETCQ